MKICFWGDVARVLKGSTTGGGELQIGLLAMVLAKLGHEVVVLDSETATKFEVINGVKVFPIKGWNNGIPIIRTLTHRLPLLYSSLRDQNADIYYCRIRDFRHIIVYLAARKVNAKFILGLASDLDISNFKIRWRHFYSSNLRTLWVLFDGIFSEAVYPYLLRKSDQVFVQHTGQLELLHNKNISAVLFQNLIDLNEISANSNIDRQDFIYVGSFDKRKGFIQFFELVKRTPSIKYQVVGKPRDKTGAHYYEKLESFKNVTLLGQLKHFDVMNQISNSKGLVSTSPQEGFPNVFIEAWACGIPVFSLYVDPGNVIKNERLGEVANGEMDKLIEGIQNYVVTDDFAERAQNYVRHNHALNAEKIKKIDSLFKKIIGNKDSKEQRLLP
jgi:glycosyltransferase involved in cell wall biosynthesis